MAEVFDFGLQQHKIKMDGKFFENNLFAVAGDTGRRLEVQLLDSNNLVQNTTGISLRLNANVAGQATYAEATLADAAKGLYELDLPNGMLIAPGNWQFQWQIIGTSGEKLHSFAFTGSVGSNLSEGGSEATNFYLNVDDLKAMQEDLVNGTFNSEVLETNIAEKLNNLETQYAPKLAEVTAQLAQKASNISLDIERKRINTFTTLPAGSTTGDAELKDARVGADGRTYTNVGEALRNQLKLANNSLADDYLYFPYADFNLGSINNVGGNIESTSRVRSSIKSYNYPITILIAEGYEIAVALYDDNVFVELLFWYKGTYTFTPNQQFRLVIRKSDDSSLTVSEVVSSLRYSKKMLHEVTVNSQATEKLNYEMSNELSIRNRLSKSDNLLKHLLFDMNNGEYKRNIIQSNPVWNYDSDKYYTVDVGFSDYVLHFGDMSEFATDVLWLNVTKKDKTSSSFQRLFPSAGNIVYFGLNSHGYVEGLEDGSYKLFIPEYWGETYSNVEITMLSENIKKGTAYIEKINHKLPEWVDADSVKSIVFEDDIAFEIGSIEGDFGKNVDNNKRARSVDYIHFNKGDKVIALKGYVFRINIYDTNKTYSHYVNFVSEWEASEKCYIRLLVATEDLDTEIKSVENIADNILFKNTSEYDQYHAMRTRSSDGWYFLKNDIEQFAKRYSSQNVGVSLEEAKYQLLNGNNYLVRGKITKSGRHLLDQFGEPIILRGIGTHQLNDYSELRTDKSLETLKYYGVNSIRISAYLSDAHFIESDKPTHGYINHVEEIKPIIDDLITRATKLGLYMILDWHSYHAIDGDVTTYSEEQEVFFEYFSSKYASYDNIIYELHNEPYKNSILELLPSIQNCSSIIRANNPDAVIMTGINGYPLDAHNLYNVTHNLDVFISVHYYLGEQTSDVTSIVNSGVHLFVSEWGNSGLSGTGVPNYDKARAFIDECERLGVSHNCWKLTHQDVDTSVVVNNPIYVRFLYPIGGYTRGDLTENGKMYFDKFKEYGIEALLH